MFYRFLALISFLICLIGFTYYKKSRLDDYLESAEKKELVQRLPSELVFDSFDLTREVKPEEYAPKGRRIFLHFWATWCAPCEKEFPELEKLIESVRDQGSRTQFVFVALNDQAEKLEKFLKRFKKLKSEVLFLRDEKGFYKKFLGVTKVPETWIFDESGVVRHRFQGPQDWKQKYFLRLF